MTRSRRRLSVAYGINEQLFELFGGVLSNRTH
jgi:hypothetical protein